MGGPVFPVLVVGTFVTNTKARLRLWGVQQMKWFVRIFRGNSLTRTHRKVDNEIQSCLVTLSHGYWAPSPPPASHWIHTSRAAWRLCFGCHGNHVTLISWRWCRKQINLRLADTVHVHIGTPLGRGAEREWEEQDIVCVEYTHALCSWFMST